MPIFEGGRLIANWRGSEVNYNLAISHYNELVLNAAKEVLEGITLLRNANYQLQELKNVTSSQTINFDLMAQRVSHNLNSRLDYLTSEELMLRAKLQEAQGLGNIYRSIVTLIKALGGGY